MAYGPGNLSRRVARQRHGLGLTREQVVTGQDKYIRGVDDVLVILSERCPTSSWRHRRVPPWRRRHRVCRRGQAVQPAVMAISRPISAVLGSYTRVRYLTVSGGWPR